MDLRFSFVPFTRVAPPSLPIPAVSGPLTSPLLCVFLRRPLGGRGRRGRWLPDEEALRLYGEDHPDLVSRVPASHQGQRLTDARSLDAYPEAGRAAPDLHGDLHHLLLHRPFSLHSFPAYALHAPLKRDWQGPPSPVRAMSRARRKMARSGHKEQVLGRGGFRAGRAGDFARPGHVPGTERDGPSGPRGIR